jgi:cytochrome c
MSSGLELNKIAASVLLAGIIAMFTGFIADALYKPNTHSDKRGYQVAVTEEDPSADAGEAPKEEVFLVGQLMAMADAAAGKENFKKCAACHNIEKGGATKVGPDLWGILGADKGHHEGYPYSKAMLEKGGKWTYDDIFHFLHSPRTFVPGTKMGFVGFKNKTDIANMVAYLRTMTDNAPSLPPVEAAVAETKPAAAETKPAAEAKPIVDAKPAAETTKPTTDAKPPFTTAPAKPEVAPKATPVAPQAVTAPATTPNAAPVAAAK